MWDPQEEYIFRYFQMYIRANANPKPEADGSFFIGDCEDAAPKNWCRYTPYSLALPKSKET
jgi:hypothetical protein